MKIQIWAPEFARFGGGIGAFSRELAESARQLGHDVSLWGYLDTARTWNGFTLRGAGHLPRALARSGFAARVLSECARTRPQLIISTHLNFGPVARIARSIAGTRYFLVAHGVDVHDGLSPAKVRALRDAERIVAVSSWTRDRLLSLSGIGAARISLLPNTVDTAKFAIREYPRALAERYSLKPAERVILTVARLGPTATLGGYKGCDRLLESLPAIAATSGPVRYIIAGDGPDRPRLERIARENGVGEMVTFAGFVDDSELPDHYRLADVFAMPSTGEGFGIVFLEAMACGTPVVAGNADGSVDALDAGRLGELVDPCDPARIADGVRKILEREGPAFWFDRKALHEAVEERFGRAAFRARVAEILAA